MYPITPTHTEELIQMIRDKAPKITDIIKDYIDSHNRSAILEGVNYYFNKSDIKKRQKYYYDSNGNQVIDDDAINNKIPHGWHKLLVDQKVAYLVGQPVTITSDDDLASKVSDALGDDFDDTLPELVKNSSNKGREWLHPYINEEGSFDYVIIPAEQVIPIYDNSKRKNLEAAIRYYTLDDETLKIELWDRDTVTYYEHINGEVVLDVMEEVNPASHFYYGTEDDVQGYGWGEVPFIEFMNNDERVSDLTFYKELIDNFDLNVSNTADNLEEIQSLILALKGYDGESLAEFKQNLKYYKIIKTSDEPGSGVDTIKNEVPIQSVDSHLDRLIDSIFMFGQGVNINSDKFGNSPSGIALKFLYSLLDMKSNVMERKFLKALTWLYWFAVEYLKMKGEVPDTTDYKTIKTTFNHSMLVNEAEQVTMAQESKGIISNRTILEHHPWVEDVEQEEKRIEDEQGAYPLDMSGDPNAQ